MFLKQKERATTEAAALNEFKRLWNDELMKEVESRDFSKAYNYASRKHNIRDMCMKNYFDFTSENSPRFKEACDAFDEGDIFWTFMLIRQFASVPVLSSKLKNLTNRRRYFLTEKRKDSVITRYSVRMYLHNLMNTSDKKGETFIKEALEEYAIYKELVENGNYRTAYKNASLSNKAGDYISNMKKYLYYAARREITPENAEETRLYFEYVGKYFNFWRYRKEGEKILVNDIDIIISQLIYLRNGGDVSYEDLFSRMHRTVKVYCSESVFPPICMLADYLYYLGETEMEKMVLKLLVYYGQAINEKYKKRYTCLELMYENSNKFVFRHKAHTPLECVVYDSEKDNLEELFNKCVREKEKNSWCLAVKREIKTYGFNHKFFYDDKLLSTLETVLDKEFGDFVLEYPMRTFFSGDTGENAKHSMLIITSGKNQYADFPKIGVLIKLEPITKKFTNVHYCVLYLPEEEYTEEGIKSDIEYIKTLTNSEKIDSRFKTFEMVVENLTWNTIDELLNR